MRFKIYIFLFSIIFQFSHAQNNIIPAPVNYEPLSSTFKMDSEVLMNIQTEDPKIIQYGKDHNHIIVEDCAQSTGSGSGNKSHFSIFSFYPTKPLSAMGDGGMICSNNTIDYCRSARFYGVDENILGINSRMDEFQAAIVRVKIPYLHELNNRRKKIAKFYKTFVDGITVNSNCVYHQFVVRFKNRDQIIKNIPYMIHYPKHVNELLLKYNF